MTSPRLTSQTFKDAGLLREYVAAAYGATLAFGGSSESMRRALRLCRRLSRMTGIPEAQVHADIRADYEAAQ